MQKAFPLFMALTLMSLSSVVLAHGGHNHMHWLSLPIHLLVVAAVATIVVAGVALFKRRAVLFEKCK